MGGVWWCGMFWGVVRWVVRGPASLLAALTGDFKSALSCERTLDGLPTYVWYGKICSNPERFVLYVL